MLQLRADVEFTSFSSVCGSHPASFLLIEEVAAYATRVLMVGHFKVWGAALVRAWGWLSAPGYCWVSSHLAALHGRTRLACCLALCWLGFSSGLPLAPRPGEPFFLSRPWNENYWWAWDSRWAGVGRCCVVGPHPRAPGAGSLPSGPPSLPPSRLPGVSGLLSLSPQSGEFSRGFLCQPVTPSLSSRVFQTPSGFRLQGERRSREVGPAVFPDCSEDGVRG